MRAAAKLQLQQQIPEALKIWLYASGSLTQQLTDLAGGVFKVQPIEEQYQRLLHADAQWMNMPHQHTSWVRESYLYGCEDAPWVKAKSIFPILSLQSRARIFQHIGKKPIGWFLFQRTNPVCQRRVILLEDGWTRQSCYTWHGCKFIVQETFLPAFERFIQQKIKQ
ncbi:chorismate--pyruvate lyase [Acinetobacter sp. ANC 4169]|uniref:chorismate--pyruvate lyase family protein n=1 Tax=Acinetobacter sp. ANC 4169 TaxID=1977879 RepID=UPI000A342146|nr:chorismate lyase [Acinetobacter sp. ANC 4169]OTG69734.1 chorismate--pyruvate lyase [Acinetobacter sp. ANC 4169]